MKVRSINGFGTRLLSVRPGDRQDERRVIRWATALYIPLKPLDAARIRLLTARISPSDFVVEGYEEIDRSAVRRTRLFTLLVFVAFVGPALGAVACRVLAPDADWPHGVALVAVVWAIAFAWKLRDWDDDRLWCKPTPLE
ncbi:MAG: hypothetical protein KC609_21960 [Myxococcales bacterium]|nr:hypothetical protein [Myxococcales bacterium]